VRAASQHASDPDAEDRVDATYPQSLKKKQGGAVQAAAGWAKAARSERTLGSIATLVSRMSHQVKW
jgi:hypothetical protein